jgi:hypothetical protein
MKKQPDFMKIFYDYFGDKPKKVTYEVRFWPYRFFDLIFLNALIHDAIFKLNEIHFSGKRLSIPVERFCWELPRINSAKNPEKYSEVYKTNARIVISPVLSIEWYFRFCSTISPDIELEIHNIWMEWTSRSPDDIISVVIDGIDWKCILRMHEDDVAIRVIDIEVPKLIGQQKGRK